MGGSPPQGLTAHDFHHQKYINPRDIFPSISQQTGRIRSYRGAGPSIQESSYGSPRFVKAQYGYQCCPETSEDFELPPGLSSCCVDDYAIPTNLPSCCGESSPSLASKNASVDEDCIDCFDQCDDCLEDHTECVTNPIECIDDCDECVDEHLTECNPQQPTCMDDCDDCDFSCFDCIDWNEFERNKTLGLSYSVSLLGNDHALPIEVPMADRIDAAPGVQYQTDLPVLPLEIPMHHQCFQDTATFWSNTDQSQLCSGIPQTADSLYQPMNTSADMTAAAFSYGCHPATAHQQAIWQASGFSPSNFPPQREPESQAVKNTAPLDVAPTVNKGSQGKIQIPSPPENYARACQWLMPCGTTCGASFATIPDLRKHLKQVHVTKGTLRCAWDNCGATFASEAALTGHVSKKHLPLSAFSDSEEGPFKCTFAGCPKSFMYKQVRDDHVATSHKGNKMYCHICGQFLNGEGSNFRRHMASHRPKHQHMSCKHHHLGCKRRFPRLDNLRRHEACCKFGKRLKGKGVIHDDGQDGGRTHLHHHHHHHRHVGH